MEAAVASNDLAVLVQAQAEWESAAAEYASTPEGNQHLRAQAEAADAQGDFDTMALLNTVVAKGEAMRAANRDASAFLRAARMSQTPVAGRSLVEAATGGYDGYTAPASSAMVVPDDVPPVPVLSTRDQEKWDKAVSDFNELLPHIHAINAGSSMAYASDIEKDFPVIGETLDDPEATDEDVASAVNRAGYYSAFRVAHPQWKADKVARESRNFDDQMDQETRKDLDARWGDLSPRLTEGFEVQAERALDHPNAGYETFRSYANRFDKKTAAGNPNAPLTFVKKIALDTPPMVPEAGWERLRAERFEDNSIAMVVAAKDPDSFQRTEAFNQVMTMSMDTVSARERNWLASNLSKMPGSDETQRILAHSMASWAKGYADTEERTSMGAIFTTSNNVGIQAIGNDLMGRRTVDLDRAEPRRRKIFGRG